MPAVGASAAYDLEHPAGLGGSGWGSPPSATPLQLLTALSIAENLVLLTFNQDVYFSGLLDPTDAYPKKELKKWRRHIILEKPAITVVLDEVPGSD